MDGRTGRVSLTADAAYCALVAVCCAVFAGPLAAGLAVPRAVVLAAAAVTALWALALGLAARAARLRGWLAVVLAVNVGGVLGLGALAAARPFDLLSLLLAAVALEVAAFAASQALALRRPA